MYRYGMSNKQDLLPYFLYFADITKFKSPISVIKSDYHTKIRVLVVVPSMVLEAELNIIQTGSQHIIVSWYLYRDPKSDPPSHNSLFPECPEVIWMWENLTWNTDMLEFFHSVIHAPHENGEKRLVRPVTKQSYIIFFSELIPWYPSPSAKYYILLKKKQYTVAWTMKWMKFLSAATTPNFYTHYEKVLQNVPYTQKFQYLYLLTEII